MPLNFPDTPSGWMQALLQPWLDDEHRDPKRLADWLDGYSLPPVDPGYEPYLWLLQGLPTGAALPDYEEKLAHSLVSALDSASGSDKAMFNLLALSARLRCAPILAPALRRLRQSNALAGRAYLGIALPDALRDALSYNQPDYKMEKDWMALIEGQPVADLSGDWRHGFDGINRMQDNRRSGTPPVTALGKALKKIAAVVGGRTYQRVDIFADLLLEVCERFPGHFESTEFIEMSNLADWPEWTDLSLPILFFETGPDRYVVWRTVAQYARERDKVRQSRSWCQGRIVEIVVSPAFSTLMPLVGGTFDEHRYRLYDPGLAIHLAWCALSENRYEYWPRDRSAEWEEVVKAQEGLPVPLGLDLAAV